MPRAVYSTRFIAVPFGPPASAGYVVPTGFVAVIRDIAVRFTGGSGGPFVVQVADPALIIAVLEGADAITGMAEWSGRQICNEGEEVDASNEGSADGSCMVSGYLLAL